MTKYIRLNCVTIVTFEDVKDDVITETGRAAKKNYLTVLNS